MRLFEWFDDHNQMSSLSDRTEGNRADMKAGGTRVAFLYVSCCIKVRISREVHPTIASRLRRFPGIEETPPSLKTPDPGDRLLMRTTTIRLPMWS